MQLGSRGMDGEAYENRTQPYHVLLITSASFSRSGPICWRRTGVSS